MNRINKLFNEKPGNILSIYFTAGYPTLNDTVNTITELENNGVDLIEIGIPFSDPVADGPVIQESSSIALKNGMNLKLLFLQLKDIRRSVSLPLIMMGYINPVYQMGMENFLRQCADAGIDGVIIPDLPVEEYLAQYENLFKKYNIHFICLITPQSPEERIRFIDSISDGFIYMVSSSSTTGGKNSFDENQLAYFKRVKSMNLKNPLLAGFGISNAYTFNTACEYANGAIIGSAFIKAMGSNGVIEDKIKSFISPLFTNTSA
jgi:tryptophan synthase alpha chain